MTTQNQIRQSFMRDLTLREDAWLIQGDFDHFKWINDVYGALIADTLLDWTLEVIEAVLRSQQKRWGCDEFLCSVIGDDLTIYIPPSPLKEDDLTKLLWKIRNAIRASFWRRYRVGTLPIPADFFEDVAPDRLERMRNELEHMDVVLDFAMRQRGFLLLFPVGPDGQTRQVLDRVIGLIQRSSGKALPTSDLRLDWICNPEDRACCTFNDGFLDAPVVSFAACGSGRHDGEDAIAVYERVSCACQSALKICKQQRSGVLVHKVHKDGTVLADGAAHPAKFSTHGSASHLRWASERYLRENSYFRRLDRPLLFQLNPVYSLTAKMPADSLQYEKYRGNPYGIGLKGINELCGQNAADRLIWLLISIFSGVMQNAFVLKRISPESVGFAQFVDRLTVCCEQPVFQPEEIIELVRCLLTQFNAVSDEIKISQLRTSIVLGEGHLMGYALFEQLALTSLASPSSNAAACDPRIEVRKNCRLALQAGRIALEQNCFTSAGLLTSILQP
jgi:GGDEF domain-containing protein